MISIPKYIQRVCRKKLPIPTFFIIITTLILILCPFINIFHPTVIDNIYNVTEKNSYVNVTADTLYYTGYNLIKSGNVNYGYYYAIKDETCIFTIIPINEKPKSVINNYRFKAKLIKPNKAYNQMLSAFAKDLNWNEEALYHVSKKFVLSNADYHPTICMLFLWVVLVILFISVKKLFEALYGLINPTLYPVCTFLEKQSQKNLIENAGWELSGDNCIQINSMYLTPNFFIDFGKNNISIIPLNDIIWCYRLGMISPNPISHKHEYSLFFVMPNGSVIVSRHKTNAESLEMINAIRATKYDIIIGYSNSKRKLAKQICRNNKQSV